MADVKSPAGLRFAATDDNDRDYKAAISAERFPFGKP